MGYDEDFDRLDGFVGKLLASHEKMKQEQQTLLAEFNNLEQRHKALQEEVAQLQDEKNQVQQRIAGLVDSISKWEQAHNNETREDVTSAPVSESLDGEQDNLFSQ